MFIIKCVFDVNYPLWPHPKPLSKGEGLKKSGQNNRSDVKILSKVEDLGEAKQNAYAIFAFNKYIYFFKRQRYE